MRRKIITPKTVSRHIEEEFRKSPAFTKAYDEELARLQIGYKIARLRQMRHLSQAELAKKVRRQMKKGQYKSYSDLEQAKMHSRKLMHKRKA